MKQIRLITDGACLGNPGRGGWAYILRYGGHTREMSGSEPETTNNRMELTAAIEGLRALKEGCEVEVVTDSEYLKNGITTWIHGWKRNGWKTASKKAGNESRPVDGAGRSGAASPGPLDLDQGSCGSRRQQPLRRISPARGARAEIGGAGSGWVVGATWGRPFEAAADF